MQCLLCRIAFRALSETKTQLIVALWQTGGLYLVYFKISQRAPRVINLYSYHLVVVVVFYFVFYSYHLVVVVLFFTLTIWLLLLFFVLLLFLPFGCLPTFESLHLHLLHCAHWDHTCRLFAFSSASAITEAGGSHQYSKISKQISAILRF